MGVNMTMAEDARSRRVWLVFSLVLILGVVLSIPQPYSAQDTTAKICGYVYRAGSSDTISGVLLETEDGALTTFSDSAGYYCLQVSPGVHIVSTRATNYTSCSWEATVDSGDLILNFYLLPASAPTYSVKGTVIDDETGMAITGAFVEIPSIGYGQTTGMEPMGTYLFTLPNGTYEFRVSGPGYQNFSAEVTITDANVTKDFSLDRSGQDLFGFPIVLIMAGAIMIVAGSVAFGILLLLMVPVEKKRS